MKIFSEFAKKPSKRQFKLMKKILDSNKKMVLIPRGRNIGKNYFYSLFRGVKE